LGLLTAYLPQYPYRDAKAADRIDSRDLDWFFESPEFNQWYSHDSEFLWLSGTPKSGKTLLSFCLWDRLKRNWTYTNTGDIVIFFCLPPSDSRATATDQTAQVLSTIVRQLLHSNQKRLELVVQQCPMPELLRQRISMSPSQLLLNELWKILSASVIAVPSHPVIIIIDGIDELRTEEARQIFLQNLLQLQSEVKSKGVRGFKIFITSKPFNDIRKTLTGVLNIEKDKERQRK
jgi:Cdc6-like AAA superfamily ATPase